MGTRRNDPVKINGKAVIAIRGQSGIANITPLNIGSLPIVLWHAIDPNTHKRRMIQRAGGPPVCRRIVASGIRVIRPGGRNLGCRYSIEVAIQVLRRQRDRTRSEVGQQVAC